jgi:hypothetical protein
VRITEVGRNDLRVAASVCIEAFFGTSDKLNPIRNMVSVCVCMYKCGIGFLKKLNHPAPSPFLTTHNLIHHYTHTHSPHTHPPTPTHTQTQT